jgi:hypothetical protein
VGRCDRGEEDPRGERVILPLNEVRPSSRSERRPLVPIAVNGTGWLAFGG